MFYKLAFLFTLSAILFSHRPALLEQVCHRYYRSILLFSFSFSWPLFPFCFCFLFISRLLLLPLLYISTSTLASHLMSSWRQSTLDFPHHFSCFKHFTFSFNLMFPFTFFLCFKLFFFSYYSTYFISIAFSKAIVSFEVLSPPLQQTLQ